VKVSMTTNPVTDTFGRVIGYLFVATDITDTRRSQEILVKALRREREVVSRLQYLDRAKDDFVSTVSHELRTPVTSIAGSLALLSKAAETELSDKSASLVEIASRNAIRLKHLVNDLLDMDRIESGAMSFTFIDVDLRTVLRAVVEENGPFANEANVTLELHEPQGPIAASTDRDRLFQAVTNLVSNAAKFSGSGSVVRITLEQSDGSARIRVSDEGPGVPEEFRSRLFDRFTQSDHTRESTSLPGTGLGLAITKGIVEQLGGVVWLDETVETGATFEIVLPLPGAQAPAASAINL